LKSRAFKFEISAKSRDFKLPDCKSKDFSDAFIKSLIKIEDSIMSEIRQMAGDNESEVARIENACIDSVSWDEFDNNDRVYFEFVLSMALCTCRNSAYLFEEGDLLHAFRTLITAASYLGNAHGHNTAANKNSLKKKEFYRELGDKRHEKNRSTKQQAMDYYKDKYAADIVKIKGQKGKNKDKAASDIEEKFNIGWRTARKYIDEFHRENTPS
jgi:hypothetical protein